MTRRRVEGTVPMQETVQRKPRPPRRSMNVRVPVDLYGRYLGLSDATDRSVSSFVTEAMRAAIDGLEAKYGQEGGGRP